MQQGGHRGSEADDPTAALTSLPIDQLRARRSQRKSDGDSASYLRRLVQGRLDIVRHEVTRRDAGEAAASLSDLVAALPETLGNRVVGSGPGRPSRFQLMGDDPALVAELDAVCGPSTLAHLPELDLTELHRLADALAELEAVVSVRRRQIFVELDVLSHELTRRYRTGEASIDDLLAGDGSPR
jgi:hypothetical protein